MLASDLVILGILASAEIVTHYSLSKYIPEALMTLVGVLVFGAAPGLGGIIGRGDLKKAAQVRNEIMVFTWLVVTAGGSTILLWNESFLRLLVGPEHYVGSLPALLIVIMVVQFVFIRNDSSVIDLTLNRAGFSGDSIS
jgi:Na+-driven multidrug efflux pump